MDHLCSLGPKQGSDGVRLTENKLPLLPAHLRFFLAVNFRAIEPNPEEAAFTLKHTEA